jgi:hypothetical protein
MLTVTFIIMVVLLAVADECFTQREIGREELARGADAGRRKKAGRTPSPPGPLQRVTPHESRGEPSTASARPQAEKCRESAVSRFHGTEGAGRRRRMAGRLPQRYRRTHPL